MLGMKNSLILLLSASIFYVLDNAYIILSVPSCIHVDLDENRLKEKIRKKYNSGWDSHFSRSGSKCLRWRSWKMLGRAGQGNLF